MLVAQGERDVAMDSAAQYEAVPSDVTTKVESFNAQSTIER
jgi:hypothetical protein